MTGVLIRGKCGHRHTRRRPYDDRLRRERCSYKPRNIWGYQHLEKARKDTPLEASEEEWSHKHLDFRLLASKN